MLTETLIQLSWLNGDRQQNAGMSMAISLGKYNELKKSGKETTIGVLLKRACEPCGGESIGNSVVVA